MAGGQNNFYTILTAAINDLAEHGYDSVERVTFWTEQLRKAAYGATKSFELMRELLYRALHTVYKRYTTGGEALRRNPGVSRFTLDKVEPLLRAELDRRIMASANLIKLNREQAIETTLRRFQGWATSIPVGGSAEPEVQKAKKDIRKSVAGLPFVERRVLIDQGHKLGAAISDTIAVNGGAIAGKWRSNWRQAGYDYRTDHKERDEQVYLIRDSWAQKQGFVKPGSVGYSDNITQPAEEPFCRCSYIYLYHLRQLPDDMVTKKGREALEAIRKQQ